MRRVNLLEIGQEQDNYYFHLARYMLVYRQLRGHERILEVGCGSGYGTRLLSDKAKQVIGVDQEIALKDSWDVLTRENLKFQNQVPDDKFDIVVCFEVIEHIELSEVSNFLRMLKSKVDGKGVVYLSTPRALPFNERSKNRQIEHKHEFSPIEFKALLDENFSHAFLFGQNDGIISTQNLESSWNMVAICIP